MEAGQKAVVGKRRQDTRDGSHTVGNNISVRRGRPFDNRKRKRGKNAAYRSLFFRPAPFFEYNEHLFRHKIVLQVAGSKIFFYNSLQQQVHGSGLRHNRRPGRTGKNAESAGLIGGRQQRSPADIKPAGQYRFKFFRPDIVYRYPAAIECLDSAAAVGDNTFRLFSEQKEQPVGL